MITNYEDTYDGDEVDKRKLTSDWSTSDPTDESEEHRIYVSLGSISKGPHLFDIADNMSVKFFLEGLFEFIDGTLWQHAAVASDIDVLAVIPNSVATSGLADRLRRALARYLDSTRLADNDLLPFRFAVREAIDLDSATFIRECERIMHLRIEYTRMCAFHVGGLPPKGLPIDGRSRRKRWY